jgi:hypothetical protein
VLTLALVSCLLAADKDESRATALWRNMREEDALGLLTEALERDHEPEVKARLYVLLGLAKLNLRDNAGARTAFMNGLAADEKVDLPKGLASPRAREVFEALKPAPAPQKPSSARRWVGGGLAVLGVAGAVAGIGLQLHASNVRLAAEAEPVAVRALQLAAEAQQHRTTSLVVLSVGLTALFVGALLLVWPASTPPDAQVGVLLGPGELGLAFSRSF